MRAPVFALLQPLHWAGLGTLAAVALSLRGLDSRVEPGAWGLLVAFAVAFLAHDAVERRHAAAGHALLVVQGLLALALVAVAPRTGTSQVLLVMWVAGVVGSVTPRTALAVALVANVIALALLIRADHPAPWLSTLLYAGFQAFGALCMHYAASAERARDALARVNADLLATRALLADRARDAERLRVARELHDVAGHKLTAMALNLRALATDPAFSGRTEVAVAQQMAGELLADIRNVVQALRDTRGLDLATALHALAAPMPRPRLELDIDERACVDDPALAETVLRLVQEALTNSARHSAASRVHVAVHRNVDTLDITIDDDGRVRGPLREGNGLSGMRERVVERGGCLHIERTSHDSLRIRAALPL